MSQHGRLMRLFNALVFTVAVFTSSCSLLEADGDFVANITPDKQVYRLTDSTEVELTIENVSSSTIYYSTCGSQRLNKLEGGNIVNTSTIDRVCRCVCRISIEPGQRKKLTVGHWWLGLSDIQLRTGEKVSYQFAPFFYTDKKMKQSVSEDAVQAGPFRFTK